MSEKEAPVILPRSYIVWGFFIWLLYKTYQNSAPELVAAVYFVIVGFAFCELYITYIKTQLKIKVESVPDHINKGEKTTLKLTIFNQSFLPSPYVYIFLKESYHIVSEKYHCLCVTLPPHSSREFTFHLKAVNSGKEKVGIEKVIISDYMELARRNLAYQWLQEVTILPQPYELKSLEHLMSYALSSEEEETDARITQVMEEGDISYDLKPYNEGEPQRLIHWKLAAQRDIYMVRQREQILKMKRQRLVIIDPVVRDQIDKGHLIERFSFEKRIRHQWETGRRKAELKDKLVNGTMSYLLEILRRRESILLYYYEKNEWHAVDLLALQDLEKVSDQLSGGMLEEKERPSARWPETPKKHFVQRILICAQLDAAMREELLSHPEVKVLELQHRSAVSEDSYDRYWYLTDDHQIVRNG